MSAIQRTRQDRSGPGKAHRLTSQRDKGWRSADECRYAASRAFALPGCHEAVIPRKPPGQKERAESKEQGEQFREMVCVQIGREPSRKVGRRGSDLLPCFALAKYRSVRTM